MKQDPKTIELIKWTFKETFRPNRIKNWIKDSREELTGLTLTSIRDIGLGLLGVIVILLSPLIAAFRIIKMLLWDPITLPIRKREHILKLKAKWEKGL